MHGTIDESFISAVSSRLLKCMLITDALPGAHLRNVRVPPKGFLGWLLRTEERLTGTMHPELRRTSHVRGVRVAIDYLLEAFLQRSQYASFTLVVPDRQKEDFERWASAYASGDRHCPLEICTATQVLGRGTRKTVPDVWIELRGVSHLAFRLRDHISSRIIPAMILQHGLSEHVLLYELYLRALLTPHYACDSLVCTSTSCKAALAKIFESIAHSFNKQHGTDLRFNGRLDVIPLCVDIDQCRPRDKYALRKQLGIPTGTLLLLYVGYLSQIKADLTSLLSTTRRLIAANPRVDIRLAIAGTGPEEYYKELLNVIEELDLAKKVIVMREVSDMQKQQLFGAADVFVGPCQSMQECFGLTPVEAMACGLPQVVADWNGYRDTVVHGDTGFLVPTIWGRCDGDLCCTGDLIGWPFDHIVQGQSIVMDPNCMYEYLHILINNPELRGTMSERSRARAVAQFSYANIARLYDELWTELQTIATTVQPTPHAKHFDQPAYFDYFGHFASFELGDDLRIHASDNGPLTVERLVNISQAELHGISILDSKLLTALTDILVTAERASEVMSVGQLIEQAASKSWSDETVRRHILFSLKHGRMSIAVPNNSTTENASRSTVNGAICETDAETRAV